MCFAKTKKVAALAHTEPRTVGRGTLAKRFQADDRGNVAIIFALTTMVVVSVVGGAVDYGRWLSARSQTQSAVDSALLAAGRAAQTSYGDGSAAVAAANAYYAQMKSDIIVGDTITFQSSNLATTFSATGTAYVNTPFLSIVGITQLPVLATSGVEQATSTIAQGGNSGSSVELSMMLDTTGSMAGQKLTDLKAAASDLVDIVIWSDQSQYTSKIALAPFSAVVNVGDYFQQVTNQNPTPASHYVYPTNCYNSNGTLKNSCKNQSQYLVVDNIAKAKCVTERLGEAELTDDVPSGNRWVTTYNDALAYNYSNLTALVAAGATNKASWDTLTETKTTTCPERTSIVPLTSDKTLLKNTINSFVAENATAGAIGHAWAWYLLSPNWGTIFTGTSKPESYSKLTELGSSGMPKLQKVAVLMTDGAYNTTGGAQYSDNSAPTAAIRQRAKDLCSGMKAKGITVYTVGFQVGSDTNAVNLLSQCATDSTYFYNAADGTALRQAFRDIALKISALRLSH